MTFAFVVCVTFDRSKLELVLFYYFFFNFILCVSRVICVILLLAPLCSSAILHFSFLLPVVRARVHKPGLMAAFAP